MNNYLENEQSKVTKAANVFIANNATVFGQITIGEHSSIWYNAVLRGDSDTIEIGSETNVQDGCIIHVDPGKPVKIGDGCVLGHAVIAHGCTIGNNTLIGMRATVMNGAVIGENCIIGAHALITENKIIPDNSLVLGSPASVVRELLPLEIEKIRNNAKHYKELAMKYLE